MENNPDKEFEDCIATLLNINENTSKMRKDFKDDISVSRLRVIYNSLVNKIVVKDEIKNFEKQKELPRKNYKIPEMQNRTLYSEIVSNRKLSVSEPRKYSLFIKSKNNQTPKYTGSNKTKNKSNRFEGWN